MVALAATALEAYLIDTNTSGGEFASASLDQAYKSHLIILTGLRIQRAHGYHKLTHGICRAVTARRFVFVNNNLTHQQILAQVEWDSIQ